MIAGAWRPRLALGHGPDMEGQTSMSTQFDSIERDLLEATEHAEGRSPLTSIHRFRAVDVTALRANVSKTVHE